MWTVKCLNVTMPCSFTSASNECITEATGWSQCRVVHLHPTISPPHHAGQAPLPIPYPPRKRCSETVTNRVVFRSKNLYHATLQSVLEISPCKGGQCLSSHLCPLEWRHPWGSCKKDRAWRHCIRISMQRRSFVTSADNAHVPSVHHDVINVILGIRWGITSAPHMYK